MSLSHPSRYISVNMYLMFYLYYVVPCFSFLAFSIAVVVVVVVTVIVTATITVAAAAAAAVAATHSYRCSNNGLWYIIRLTG